MIDSTTFLLLSTTIVKVYFEGKSENGENKPAVIVLINGIGYLCITITEYYHLVTNKNNIQTSLGRLLQAQ